MLRIIFVFFFTLFYVLMANGQADTSIERLHNKIDDITSKEQIEDLLKSLKPYFSTFRINDSMKFSDKKGNRISDSLHCNAWFKTDFDNNGFTDLLVIGSWDNHAIFCILDSGDNRFAVDRLTRKIFQNCTLPVLKKIGTDNVILYYSLDESAAESIKVDTLIYKFGGFVEHNFSAENYDIQKIEFSTTECFGECPQFNLVIDSNRNAKYSAIKYNKKYGEFKGVINENNYTQLTQLLNYIDFPELKNNYEVNWKNDQGCTLKINYDNGKVKTIYDYGLHGTFGLERVYQILFGLRDNQEWH